MDDIYTLSDPMILQLIGTKFRYTRLKFNTTQKELAVEAGISISTLKKMESGKIASFDAFIRVIRTLGLLDYLQPLIDIEQLSPNEYYEFVHAMNRKVRKRARQT